MANHQRQSHIKLQDAVKKSKEQYKVLQWTTNGCPIKHDLQLPTGSVVLKTSIIVGNNGLCMVLFLCKIPCRSKITVISGGDFSSLNDLELHHPELFEINGIMKML